MATYYISSDAVTSGVSDAYSVLFVDRDGYDMDLVSGTVINKGWDQNSGFWEVDENKFTAGYGSGTYGNVKDTIVAGTKYGIVADTNNIWVIISGSKVPYEMWGSGTYYGVAGTGTADYMTKWKDGDEIEDAPFQYTDVALYSILSGVGTGSGSHIIGHHLCGGNTRTVHDMLNIVTPQWLMCGGTISDDGGLNVSWTEGSVYDHQYSQDSISFPSGSLALTDDAVNYLYLDTSAAVDGTGSIAKLTTKVACDDVIVGHAHCLDGDIYGVVQECTIGCALTQVVCALGEIFPIIITEGLLVSDNGANLNLQSSSGTYYEEVHDMKSLAAIDSTVTSIRRWYHDGAGNWTSDINASIDTENYDTGTGLAAIPLNKYAKGLTFLTSKTEINFVYPTETHVNVTLARDSNPPAMPSSLEHFPKSVSIVYQDGDTDLSALDNDNWRDLRPLASNFGVIAEGGGGTGVTDHGALTGLADDDHPHYASLAQNETVTGAWSINNNFELSRVGAGGNVTLTIEADSDNNVEASNPSIILKQDGGAITFEIGIQESGNFAYMEWADDLQLKGDVDITGELVVAGKANANAALRIGGTAVDPASDSYVNLGQVSNVLSIYTNYGQMDIGPRNTSYCHIDTDRANFYFYKGASMLGHFLPATDSIYNLGSSTKRFNNLYIDGSVHDGSYAYNLHDADGVGSTNKHKMVIDLCGQTAAGNYDDWRLNASACTISNVGAQDFIAIGTLKAPTNKGASLQMWLYNIHITIVDGDNGDELDRIYIYGHSGGTSTLLDSATGLNTYTPATYNIRALIGWVTTDVSSYDFVHLRLDFICTNANDLDVKFPIAEYYYQ